MTREEAIEELKEINFNSIHEKTILATNMAIKLLEQQPCEDAVDRNRECGREKVLDKIIAEIDTHRETLKTMADDDWYAGKIRGYDCAVEIIYKYKAESEDKE